MTTANASTDLVGLRTTLASSGVKFTDVLDALHVTPEYVGETGRGVVPAPVSVSGDQAGALASLTTMIEGVRFPKHTGKLSRTQIEDLNTLVKVIGEVEDLAKAARTSARTALLNHRDRVAEELDLVGPETPKDKEGHYLVKDARLDPIFHISEQPESITVAVSEPKRTITAHSVLADVDDDAAFDGDEQIALTRADYLAVTEPGERVLSERKLMHRIRDNHKLAPLFARAAVRSGGSLSVKRGKNAS